MFEDEMQQACTFDCRSSFGVVWNVCFVRCESVGKLSNRSQQVAWPVVVKIKQSCCGFLSFFCYWSKNRFAVLILQTSFMFWFGSIIYGLMILFVWWNGGSCTWKLLKFWKQKGRKLHSLCLVVEVFELWLAAENLFWSHAFLDAKWKDCVFVCWDLMLFESWFWWSDGCRSSLST